ncbi:hypothetical protein DNTS_017848 [Danionella cerebrum]|uniref:NFATC2-interacting protein n=1 Tax=Danionella cerebrum TaxID=2873325 RepID=A0A553R0E2_9TELE|nr:hypothetical protein DNTS_017848 [Danionella translucida]
MEKNEEKDHSPPRKYKPVVSIDLSGSEEETEPTEPRSKTFFVRHNEHVCFTREINRKLDAIGSLVYCSPEPQEPEIEYRSSPSPGKDYDDDDDIIIISSDNKQNRRPSNAEDRGRVISLKFRCRTELYKIPLLTTAPLSKAVEQLALKLNVSSSHILLLKKDMDLPVHSSIAELGLGIADIIDCVITENKREESSTSDVITVRLQGKEKTSLLEYSIKNNAPLGTVLDQYVSSWPARARRRAKFYFDGTRVSFDQTPADLDMEDGDVIEVWT